MMTVDDQGGGRGGVRAYLVSRDDVPLNNSYFLGTSRNEVFLMNCEFSYLAENIHSDGDGMYVFPVETLPKQVF